MNQRVPLLITVILVGIGLFIMVKSMMSPEMYRVTDRSEPINYVFVPDYDQFIRSNHHVDGSFWSTQDDSLFVSVHYRTPGSEYVVGRLQQIEGSNKFSFPLPSLEKGKRFFYFLRVQDAAGNQIDIKPRRTLIDRFSAGKKEKLFYVTFEGRPSRALLITHVVLILAAMLLMIHGFYYSLEHLLLGRGLSGAYWTFFFGWLLFMVSVLPLGYAVAKSAFGVGWGGFPLGMDITDNKSLGIVLYWFVLLLRGWRPQRTEYSVRTGKVSGTVFAGLSLLGILLTILAYSIPHSVFIQ
ncbi:MAG: hypothetical protein JSW03_06370 [Candidatus Eiseniibacteriota bacterium]|nr:MAG: hypothetical protein JSW03_06370 [Candidatus Eisenbacteria bacterium]